MCWLTDPSGCARASSGKRWLGGHRSQIGNAGQAEQHHRPPLLDGDAPLGIGLFEVHHEVGARPRGPHGRDLRPGIQRLTGDERPVQHDVVLAMHPTAGALPRGSPGDQLWPPPAPRRRGSPGTRPGRPGPPAPRGCDRRWPRHTRRWRLARAGRETGRAATAPPSARSSATPLLRRKSCTFRSWHGNDILRKREGCSERST